MLRDIDDWRTLDLRSLILVKVLDNYKRGIKDVSGCQVGSTDNRRACHLGYLMNRLDRGFDTD